MGRQSNKWKNMQLLSLPGITKALNLNSSWIHIFRPKKKKKKLTIVSQNELKHI